MGKAYKLICLQILVTYHGLKCEQLVIDRYPIINNYNVNLNVIDFAQVRDKALKGFNDYIENLSKQKSKKTLNWLKNHRSKLIITGLTAVYIYLSGKIAAGKTVLYDSANWANWKQDVNLSQLLTKSPNQLSHELNQSILDKYSNNNQTDLMAPLFAFNQDILQELQMLQTFSNIGKKLKSLKLKPIFLFNDHDLESANEKINRLLYLKSLMNNTIQVSLNH